MDHTTHTSHLPTRSNLPYLIALALAAVLVACEREPAPAADPALTTDATVSATALADRVDARLRRGGEVLEWSDFDDAEVHGAGLATDSVFSLGYWAGPAPDDARDRLANLDLASDPWRAALDELLAEVIDIESRARGERVSRDELLVYGEPRDLPTVALRLWALESVAALRAHPHVRYLEPMGYEPRAPGAVTGRSGAGCKEEGPSSVVAAADATPVTPRAVASWHYARHNVEQAWAYSEGAGTRVWVLDTGVADDQENLTGADYASGASAGRAPLRQLATRATGLWWWRTLDDPDDVCGHGTAMTGIVGAPRGSDGNAVGVAYRCDLTGVRASEGVVIEQSDDVNGVKDALVAAARDPEARIVSMSLGSVFAKGSITDAVALATAADKLVLAAAGTSTSFTNWVGVIFPANLEQTVAVTGVRDASPLQRCSNCHSGPAVDFTIVMQRATGDATAATLSVDGDAPRYIGGSSAATATAAGIAALVWSRYPTASRDEVIERLARSASEYPNRDDAYGWGNIDALKAVL